MSSRTKGARGAPSPSKEPEPPLSEYGRSGTNPRRVDGSTPQKQKSQKARSPGLKSPSADGTADIGIHRQGEGVVEGGIEKGDAGSRLSTYREQLVREISGRGGHSSSMKRPSPIQEESSLSPPPGMDTDLPTTTSTESGNTIRGGMTPGLVAATSVKTPSYPFPRMTTPVYLPSSLHRPFTALSPTIQSLPGGGTFELPLGHRMDKVLSNPSTPASTVTFQPAGATSMAEQLPDFPSPNLYELALMLSSEPGLNAWWQTVVQIMTECYKAERVTLAVPADSTDIENIPWGQKATFNSQGKDDRSLGYIARGSSFVPSSTEVSSISTPLQTERSASFPSRPGIPSRHSFTAYEENKDIAGPRDRARLTPARPLFARSKTSNAAPTTSRPGLSLLSGQGEPGQVLNQKALEEHDAEAEQQEQPIWENPIGGAIEDNHGRVLSVLQALDYEADPLIDHNGVRRILERGRVIALTRSYPYLDPDSTDKLDGASSSGPSTRPRSSEGPMKLGKKSRNESSSKLSSLLGGANISKGSKNKKGTSAASKLEDDLPRPKTPKYEEYEQAPPSPWSQSPAPSPAIRADPSVNPFFTDAMVDEETFNPANAPQDYATEQIPETIGVDNSWTVLHIPLIHPLSARPSSGFKLDASILEQKSASKSNQLEGTGQAMAEAPSPGPSRTKHAPIAILSVLSPIIPYPSNLRHSIEHLAPHLATSFSLCRQYANLEAEVHGLQRRRHGQTGFGALASDGRPIEDPSTLAALAYLPTEDLGAQQSHTGSITSPSDYSGPGRSITNSPSGTPGWDPSTLGLVMDKRVGVSPSAQAGGAEGYFSSRPGTSQGRYPVTPGGTQHQPRMRKNSREQSSEKRLSLKSSGSRTQLPEMGAAEREPGSAVTETSNAMGGGESAEDLVTMRRSVKAGKDAQQETGGHEAGPSKTSRHTQLHSYGAEFSSVLQGLPPGTTIPHPPKSMAQSAVTPSRAGSVSDDKPNAPPSDRLKGLILDSLPVHVFVAIPRTGLIVWVNSRYMAYRGQTIESLAEDPWSSIHPDEREDYLKAWSHSMRTGEQFSTTVRIRRFDGVYRWFQARALASRDKRNSVTQFYGSYMDIHDQHIAELKAARQEEIEMSEAKHRLLANLIPQIIFTATEDEGITFANEQWLSYTGQSFEDCLGIGFMDFVHPDDLAKCRLPEITPQPGGTPRQASYSSSAPKTPTTKIHVASSTPTGQLEIPSKIVRQTLSRHSSSGSSNAADLAVSDLAELAKRGIIKISRDSNGRLSYTTEVRLRSKKNEYRWHLIRCVEIDNVDFGNGVSSYFGSATDINDHKLLEAKLQEAMESKARFLSNMSHEIRTPLIGISGMVSFLQDSPLNEEQRDYTNTIQTSASSLYMIINDILDLSKVDAGMMKLNYEWFHTRSLIEDVNELVSTMALAKRLELNYIIEADVPSWVKGDKVRIRQVLLNVIGNAIKFTAQGEVFSRCRVIGSGAKDDTLGLQPNEIMIEFSVIDTGMGFTKKEAELIFKPFSQIDGSSTRQHGGSGLGLVISRQLVELHGGKMEGTAVPGKGSTFTFSAKFFMPTEEDHPDAPTAGDHADVPLAPMLSDMLSTTQLIRMPSEMNAKLSPPPKPAAMAEPLTDTITASPGVDAATTSSPALESSGSSDPSIGSALSHVTARSSMSSVNAAAGLARFSEAAKASGQDLTQMKLEMPPDRESTSSSSSHGLSTTPTPSHPNPGQTPHSPAVAASFRPPMYSILVIALQTHSREATVQHIEMTLPNDVPHSITAVASAEDAQRLIAGDDAVLFTHVVINLPAAEEIVNLVKKLEPSNAVILILSDSVQRQAVAKLATDKGLEHLFQPAAGASPSDAPRPSQDNKAKSGPATRATYIYKPVKPSRLAVIFDPAGERDLSIDRNRSTAQRFVETQKQSYLDMERRIGNKGYKVLLVEDNTVNQKVLQRYLRKIGVEVDVANDGEECTERVFERGWGYYAVILCDLHMPRKDGYQACRDIREWERKGGHPQSPIIALSANVMADVKEKCVDAGFSDYVTKPVDFIALSKALSKFF